jgi:hypothetical protein
LRAAIPETHCPKQQGKSGYDRSFFAGLSYLQGAHTATPDNNYRSRQLQFAW